MNADDETSGSGVDQPEQRRGAFADAQAVTRQEHTAELVDAAVKAQKKGFAALMDGLDFVEQFDASDPMRARLIEAYKAGMLRLSAALGQAEQPQGPAMRETLNSPFSGSSTRSSPGLPPSSNPRPALESSERTPKGQESVPERPRRGRPPGSKSRPKGRG